MLTQQISPTPSYFGRPLVKPSKQTILVAMGKPSGKIYGYFSIAETTFTGTETSFTMLDGVVPIESITHPTFQHPTANTRAEGLPDGQDYMTGGRLNIARTNSPVVGQYMAAVWDDADLTKAQLVHRYGTNAKVQTGLRGEIINGSVSGITNYTMLKGQDDAGLATPNSLDIPWNGFANFIDVSHTGYAHFWISALNYTHDRLTLGALIQSLTLGMASVPTSFDPEPPVPPNPENPDATMRWFANVSQSALVGACPYFDFNWVTLFQSKNQKYVNSCLVIPQNIVPTTVPAGFKVFFVNGPTVVTGTQVTYDTLRVMLIDPDAAPAGDYVFQFDVTTDQGSSPVTLTLTIAQA